MPTFNDCRLFLILRQVAPNSPQSKNYFVHIGQPADLLSAYLNK